MIAEKRKLFFSFPISGLYPLTTSTSGSKATSLYDSCVTCERAEASNCTVTALPALRQFSAQQQASNLYTHSQQL